MMKVLSFCAVLASLIIGGYCMNAAAETERFVQDRFAIGFWFDPPADENMEEHYRDIAEANFTLVIGGFGARTPEQVQRQLDYCEKFGLKALVSLPGYRAGAVKGEEALDAVEESDKFPDHPACWGFMTKDEPNASLFPNLRFIRDHLRKKRPGKLTYINLFPDYANAAQLGTPTYEEHVRRFLDEVEPDVLCMDYYPFMKPDLDTRHGYCGNLDLFRRESLRKGIPHWNFFNTMPFGPHYDPTEAQLRWQIYTSLAYGSKGVLYFCYWTPPPPGEFLKGGAIIQQDGTKTRHYEEARRINAALNNLGPTLMKLTSTGVYRVTPEDDPNEVLKDTPIKTISPGDYLVGVFDHADGKRAVLLNNYSYSFSGWPTIEFDAPVDKVVEIDQETGEESSKIDASPGMDGIQLSLDSGAGRLFLMP